MIYTNYWAAIEVHFHDGTVLTQNASTQDRPVRLNSRDELELKGCQSIDICNFKGDRTPTGLCLMPARGLHSPVQRSEILERMGRYYKVETLGRVEIDEDKAIIGIHGHYIDGFVSHFGFITCQYTTTVTQF